MRNITYLLLSILLITACSDDDDFVTPNPFVAAFDIQSSSLAQSSSINISFSKKATSSGLIKLGISYLNTENVTTVYGEDYVTSPAAEDGFIILPFSSGANQVTLDFESLINDFNEDNQQKGVVFNIVEIDYPQENSIQGYNSHTVSFGVKLGGTESPNIGGPNEQNQAYFDLSTGEYKLVQRDQWDLGFYSGETFRVVLNGSIYMATKSLETTNIDSITQDDIPDGYFTEVAIGTFDSANEEFIDNPNGDILDTAIQEIQVEPSGNEVYLLNLGYEVGTSTPNNGSIAVAGNARGWKKIRVLRQDDGYLLQYADLEDTTHQEIFIPKIAAYNFNHFSFNTESLVEVQPPTAEWDLCFTVFTNVVVDNNGNPAGSYGFSDFVVNNVLGGTKAFMLTTEDGYTYDDYVLDEEVAFGLLREDQRAIGSNWRSVFSGIFTDRFFVVYDTEGNWYKLKFLGFKNENGERGHPKFAYKLLQSGDANKLIKDRNYLNIKI